MANETAFPGPYVDQGITKRNPNPGSPALAAAKAALKPDLMQPTNTGPTDRYNDASTDLVGPFDEHTPPPHAPVAWQPDRDLYANGGGVGQDFLENQGS